MFAWYKSSAQFYAYLTDVEHDIAFVDITDPKYQRTFPNRRWFTRAWTLQELPAPNNLHPGRDEGMKFYSSDWQLLGDKISLDLKIRRITGVPLKYLDGKSLDTASISMRMSWATDQQATRSEDIAYSLLGIFDVNMPLLYGEGKLKAFRRLQEEIMKISEDETLFAMGKHRLQRGRFFNRRPRK